jgi:hypothetical protein
MRLQETILTRLIVFSMAAACSGMAMSQSSRVLSIDARTMQAQPSPERREEITQALQGWKLAWELGDADVYLRFYDPRFRGDASSRAQWERRRRALLASKDISVDIRQLRVRVLTATEVEARFQQHYRSRAHSDVGEKLLRMRRVNGAWKITQELWRPTPHTGTVSRRAEGR